MLDYQTIENRQNLLDTFEQLVESLSSTYPLEKLNKYAYTLGQQDPNEKVHFTFTAIIHGNEPSGLLILLEFLKFLKKFKMPLPFSIGIALGNYKAFLENKRFLETDLNRSFMSSTKTSWEQQRALELSALLEKTNILVDFHQTIQPSKYPFFIFPYTKRGLALASYLTTKIPIIVNWGKTFSKEGMCTDEYVNLKGGVGITIETGHKGTNPLQVSFGFSLLLKIFSLEKPFTGKDLDNIYHQLKDENLSIYTWNQVFSWPNDQDVELKSNLQNFDHIEAGKILGFYSNHEIKTEIPGYLLFPKYINKGEQKPKELFRLAKKISLIDLP